MNNVFNIINYSCDLISSGGIIIGFLLVFLESFIPALPLSVFVILNVNTFGFIIGFIISWLATSFGSYICYLLFILIGSNFSFKLLKNKINLFSNIKFSELALILTLPFTPSFLINIMCGLTKMNKKKFIGAVLIGKFFTIIFWGYIGKSFLDNLYDFKSILYVLTTIIISYILSKIINKKFKIE